VTYVINVINSLTNETTKFQRYIEPPRPFGRPFVVDGQSVWPGVSETRDWLLSDTNDNDAAAQHDERKAARWLAGATGEHASVASFNALSLHLMTHAAPPPLLLEAQRAALDEIRHAQLSYELASAFGGISFGPAAYERAAVDALSAPTLRELTLATAREGCIDETLSVLDAAAHFDERNPILHSIA
jgi:hypothetical protein